MKFDKNTKILIVGLGVIGGGYAAALTSKGYKVSERLLSVDELLGALKDGSLKEAWGCGTAAVVSPIGKLAFGEEEYEVGGGKIGEVTQELYDTLTGMQWGKTEDTFGWITRVC